MRIEMPSCCCKGKEPLLRFGQGIYRHCPQVYGKKQRHPVVLRALNHAQDHQERQAVVTTVDRRPYMNPLNRFLDISYGTVSLRL